jgi:uncharacterized membrane protein YtjA (UPF0391 family)
MITLAASMFDLSGIANGAADIGETLFFLIGALVATLVVYGLAKQRRL